jgi:hypothetical protein
MIIRLITWSNGDGSKEGVIFTEEFETDVADFIPFDCVVDFDGIIEADLPSGFPLNSTLDRI